MLEQYYSKLDLIQKYNFRSVTPLNALFIKTEISINKLEKEESENKNLDLENLSLYNFLFSRNPNIKIQNKQTKSAVTKNTQKKLTLYSVKETQKVLKTFLFDFSLVFEDMKVIKRTNAINSMMFEFKTNSKNNFVELPLPLIRRINFEIPIIKFDVFIKSTKISNYKNIFPFWLF